MTTTRKKRYDSFYDRRRLTICLEGQQLEQVAERAKGKQWSLGRTIRELVGLGLRSVSKKGGQP